MKNVEDFEVMDRQKFRMKNKAKLDKLMKYEVSGEAIKEKTETIWQSTAPTKTSHKQTLFLPPLNFSHFDVV